MKNFSILLAFLLAAGAAFAQSAATPNANAQKARAQLQSMLAALGGQRYLDLRNFYAYGSIAGFYHGQPTEGTQKYHEWVNAAGDRRVEFGKKHDDVNIYIGNACWEATYQGKRRLPHKMCEDYLRRRAHSLNTIFRQWMNNPKTLYLNDGQTLSERHLTDQITLFNAGNDSVTIQMDASTHLPRAISYRWRDPTYHDWDKERIEFDDYHLVEEVPTPFSITFFRNGSIVSQRYLYGAGYNVPLPPNAFDIDATVARITK